MFKNLVHSVLACGLLFASISTNAAVFDLRANLDGAQANGGAGTGSPATGLGIMTYDDISNLLTWDISWTNNLLGNLTNAHFHGPAAPGVNAGVQVQITVTNPTSGSATISELQETQLLSELWYINVHSTAWPGGEIRGQVNVVPIPAAAWLFGSGLLILAGFLRKRS